MFSNSREIFKNNARPFTAPYVSGGRWNSIKTKCIFLKSPAAIADRQHESDDFHSTFANHEFVISAAGGGGGGQRARGAVLVCYSTQRIPPQKNREGLMSSMKEGRSLGNYAAQT